MYKTGKEIEITLEMLDGYSSSDFLPAGTVRKAQICFKSGEQSTVYDAVFENKSPWPLKVYVLPPRRSNAVAITRQFLFRNFIGCGDDCILVPTDDGRRWYYGRLAYFRPWFGSSNNALSVSFTGSPIKPEYLSGIKTMFNTARSDIKNEIGSELELEATTPKLANFSDGPLYEKVRKISKLTLVDNIGRDYSVRGYGPEIRFSHPPLGKWRKDAIERVISAMKEIGFSAGRSAGQHVHVSHPKIKVAIYKSKNDITGMNEFLQPISCRQKNPRYGIGNNIIRDQFDCFKTLEIRVWESTTNVDLFKKRLRFSNALVKSLIRRGVDYKNIWTKMSKTMGEDYVDMLFIDNPHQIGMSVDNAMSRLPSSLKDYAREKYGWGESQQ